MEHFPWDFEIDLDCLDSTELAPIFVVCLLRRHMTLNDFI